MADRGFPTDPVLLVDDEEETLASAEVALAVGGITNVETCIDSTLVREMVASRRYSAISLDLMMPNLGGAELFQQLVEDQVQTPVVIATGMVELEAAIELMKAGAFDYLAKPIDTRRLVNTIRMAIEHYEISIENQALRNHVLSGTLRNPDSFDHIVTANKAMQGIFGYVEAVAPTSLPVLITGETGVGKELLAEAVHRSSGRSGEFVVVNTAGLDDQLFADTLFGHVKGAFTGSTTDRKGMIGVATGGTLFLDEIGDLSPESQIKLLRLVQQREYLPLGSDRTIRTDARFVFATNRDLPSLVGDDQFRKDLYYRLRSHHIHLPTLRERPEDIPLLVSLFLAKAADETGKPVPNVPSELYTYLGLHAFPGNVRELEGLVFDALVRHTGGSLSLDTFKATIGLEAQPGELSRGVADDQSLYGNMTALPTMTEATHGLIQEALKRANGNQTAAAALIGMTRTALNKRINRSGGQE